MSLRIHNLISKNRLAISNIRCCSNISRPPSDSDNKLPARTTSDNEIVNIKDERKLARPTESTSSLPGKPKKDYVIPSWTNNFIAKHKIEADLKKVPYTSTLTSHYKNPQNLVKIPFVKPFESTYECNRPLPDPMHRTTDQLKPKKYRETKFDLEGYQHEYDICIIGGGAIGASIAFWIGQRLHGEMSVLVIERDPQVSLPINIDINSYYFLAVDHRGPWGSEFPHQIFTIGSL